MYTVAGVLFYCFFHLFVWIESHGFCMPSNHLSELKDHLCYYILTEYVAFAVFMVAFYIVLFIIDNCVTQKLGLISYD